MLLTARLVIVIIAFGLLHHPLQDSPAPDTAGGAIVGVVAPPIGLQVDVPDDGWAGLVEWAEDRFALAGMDLPAGIVSIRPGEKEHCDGHSGLYRPGSVPEVRICVDRPVDSKISRFLLLHEFAHLWAENRLDAGTAEAFVAMRGLDAWQDADRPRHEWGAEHAAEVLSWGLMDELVRVTRIRDAEPDRLSEAFIVLTGTHPLVSSG